MTREEYIAITAPYRENPGKAARLIRINQICTGAVFLSYPLLLVWLFVSQSPQLLRTILIPLDGFIAVSVFRRLINRPRPYEEFALAPVLPKDTKGRSFPSRHVFSAAVIASTVMTLDSFRWPGGLLLAAAAVLGLCRVKTGVHYPSDVAAGFVLGILNTIIGCVIAGWIV